MNYITPGQVYTFRSLNLDGNSTNVISIEFDNNANASVTISGDSVLPADELAAYIFAPSSEWNVDSVNGTLNLNGNLNNYWFIYFDNPNTNYDNASATGGGSQITITCAYKKGTGKCKPSGSLEGDMACYTCVPKSTDCDECKEPVYSNSSSGLYLTVCVKAESIQIV